MRWIVRALLTLLILVAVLIGGLMLLPADRIAGLASDKLREATGREVSFEGRLAPSIWPQIGVSTGPVKLSNADWSKGGPMLTAEGLSVGVDLAALVGGDLKVRRLELTRPQILLEQAADGRANWDFTAPKAAPKTGGGQSGSNSTASKAPAAAQPFTIDKAVVSDATVRFVDHATGTTTRLDGLEAAFSLPDYAGAGTLSLSGQVNGQTFDADVTLKEFAKTLAGQVSPLSTKVTVGSSRVAFDGRAGTAPLAADGALDADVSDLGALFAALGQPAPELPPGVGKTIAVKGALTYAPAGSVHLRDAVMTLDQNRLSGAADLTLDGKPRLTGQFTAGALDLRAFTGETGKSGGKSGGGGGGKGKGGAKDSGGWSTDPIDVSALAALDAEVGIVADSVDLGSAKLGKTRILAKLTDRRLVLTLNEVRAYDGLITGTFVVNGRGGLSVGGDLNVSGLAAQTLLADLAGYDRLLGRGDMTFKFLGVGNSMDAIMNSLSGSGTLALGKGEIRGLDLAGMLRRLDTSYVGKGSKTIFDKIGGSFTIKDGVLRNEDLDFLAPLLTAGGLGKIGIGDQTLNYRVTPVALPGGEDKKGFKVPLIITGTWANPKFNLDLKAIAEQELNLKERQKELEDRAKAEAKKLRENAKAEAAKKLGVKAEDKQSLEDAAKKNLEKKAKKQLKKLFGD